jgi:tRNA-uridine 2-sulfurtransferase
MAKENIVVGMSGGVDSSISLILLKQKGFKPLGAGIKMPRWGKPSSNLEDLKTAEKICQKFKVPFKVLDLEKEFKDLVVNYFLKTFQKGQTPNPCIICNRFFKFNFLLDYAKDLGINKVATGHYAKVRLEKTKKLYTLLKAKDRKKDQSYYLALLPQNQLKRLVFPLGDYTKTQVYSLASKHGLNFSKKNSSQDFCFLVNTSLKSFLKQKLASKKGDIVNSQGKKLGEHKGLFYFTLGQRKGIKLAQGPYYVKGFDLKENKLIVSRNKNKLYKKELILNPVNLISGKKITRKTKVKAKLRYGQKLKTAFIYPLKDKLKIVFEKKQLAPTLGQYCVFYQGEVCLGGARISLVLD